VSVLDFSSYLNRFSGQTGWVVGRGPTLFDYGQLASVQGPLFFVNDAVSQECHLADGQPSFFFAHDASMVKWLPVIRSIPTLVVDHPHAGPNNKGLLRGADDPVLALAGDVILYHQHGELDQENILRCGREEIARARQLCIRYGTIHPLIHFAWYTGCARLNFVGCDGLPHIGYDERLPNLSDSTQHDAFAIRRQQEQILSALALPANYVGTPPHTVRLDCTLPPAPGQESTLTRWSGDLISVARTTVGCLSAALEEVSEAGRALRLSFEWSDIALLIRFLATPEVLRFQAVLEKLLAAEPSFEMHTRLRQ
jgi:quinol monooxygenase YgiN